MHYVKLLLRAFSYVAAVALLGISPAPALAQTSLTASPSKASEDLEGIQAAAERFLRALDDLDWEPFRASWASEPTVFFPFGDTPDLAWYRSRHAGGGSSKKRGRVDPGRPTCT